MGDKLFTKEETKNARDSHGIHKSDDEEDEMEKGNLLGQFGDSEINFDKGDSEEEKEEDKVFALGRNGTLKKRASNFFDLAKSRALNELEVKDFMFNAQTIPEEMPYEGVTSSSYKQAYFYMYGVLNSFEDDTLFVHNMLEKF